MVIVNKVESLATPVRFVTLLIIDAETLLVKEVQVTPSTLAVIDATAGVGVLDELLSSSLLQPVNINNIEEASIPVVRALINFMILKGLNFGKSKKNTLDIVIKIKYRIT